MGSPRHGWEGGPTPRQGGRPGACWGPRPQLELGPPRGGHSGCLELGLPHLGKGSTHQWVQLYKCSLGGLDIWQLWAPQRDRLRVLSVDGDSWAETCLNFEKRSLGTSARHKWALTSSARLQL